MLKTFRHGLLIVGFAWAQIACSGGSQSSSTGASETCAGRPSGAEQSQSQAAAAMDASVAAVGGAPDAAPLAATEAQAEAGNVQADASDTAAMAELPAMPGSLRSPPRPWAQMNARDRGRYMGDVVLPAMTSLLYAYDPTEFANVTCRTCHGQNASAVHFRMPNSLPALAVPGTEAAQRQFAQNPRMMSFMRERMVPAMAQLLGVQRFNPETRQGFSCFDCHPRMQ